jgi:catechol 2,3-dioxygenase-like lactoylglutathione lyase family enzyme
MKRMHIHVSVDSLPESIQFYSTLFAAEPTVIQPDYAKWMLEDPRVNFAISQRGAELGLNHLGIQVESADELAEMHQRLDALESKVTEEPGAACCYAKSDKYWAHDPQGITWETFHTLDTIPVFGGPPEGQSSASACCPPVAKPESTTTSACCMPSPKGKAAGGCC